MIPSFCVAKIGVRAHNQIVKWKVHLMVGRFFLAGSGVQGRERIIKWIMAKTILGTHARCSCQAPAGLGKYLDAGLHGKCAQWPPHRRTPSHAGSRSFPTALVAGRAAGS